MTNLKLVFNEKEDKKINVLKEKFGVNQTTELVRLLITMKYEEIQKRE